MYNYYYQSLKWRLGRFLFMVLSILVLLFLMIPVLIIIPLSFTQSSFLVYPIKGFSLRWYQTILSSEQWLDALMNSIMIAPVATLLATLLGTLAALGIVHSQFKGKVFCMGVIMSPMITPIVIIAVGIYFFFAQLGLVNTYLGLILAHALLGIPFVVITVISTLRHYDNRLSKAAASLGASPCTVFRTITLPLIAPGVLSGALFAFAISFDEVVMTLFLASPKQRTLPIQMFDGIRENIEPSIAAVATLMFLISIALLFTIEWLRRRAERLRSRNSC